MIPDLCFEYTQIQILQTVHTTSLSKVRNQVFFQSGHKQWAIEWLIQLVMIQRISGDAINVDVGIDELQFVIHICTNIILKSPTIQEHTCCISIRV